jgi:hypothetical protein
VFVASPASSALEHADSASRDASTALDQRVTRRGYAVWPAGSSLVMPQPPNPEQPLVERGTDAIEPAHADELPVIARLVVEIRSDGTRTIARGAMEDLTSGQQVAVEARAGSPLELSRALAKLLLSAPLSALRGSATPTSGGLRGRLGELGRRLISRREDPE